MLRDDSWPFRRTPSDNELNASLWRRLHPYRWPTVDDLNDFNQAGRWAGFLSVLRDRTMGVTFAELRGRWRELDAMCERSQQYRDRSK